MDIACPACSTRYSIADSAIGVDGRVVRCAKCRHSWFQDRPETGGRPDDAPQPAHAEAPIAAPATDLPPLPPFDDAPTDTSPPATYAPATYAEPPAPDFAETPSPFAHEPPFRPRRSPATFWILAIMLFVLVAAGAVTAMVNFGVPDWLPLPHGGFAAPQPDLQLNFPPTQQQWRPLPNGNSFFNVSGSITNAGRDRRAVPTLEIVLRDAHKAIVYTLETASPKPVLAPGESETIDQAIIDAPKSAESATIRWKAL